MSANSLNDNDFKRLGELKWSIMVSLECDFHDGLPCATDRNAAIKPMQELAFLLNLPNEQRSRLANMLLEWGDISGNNGV